MRWVIWSYLDRQEQVTDSISDYYYSGVRLKFVIIVGESKSDALSQRIVLRIKIKIQWAISILMDLIVMDDSPIPKIYSSWDLPTIVLTEQYDKIYKTISAEDLFYSQKDIDLAANFNGGGAFI